jgi:hypothetical protein
VRIYFVGKARRPVGLRIRRYHRASLRFQPRDFCWRLTLGADLAYRMHRLPVLMRRRQPSEIVFPGLVYHDCDLRGGGIGNKRNQRRG